MLLVAGFYIYFFFGGGGGGWGGGDRGRGAGEGCLVRRGKGGGQSVRIIGTVLRAQAQTRQI